MKISRKLITASAYVVDTGYLKFDTTTNTISSLQPAPLDADFYIEMEVVANDGQCSLKTFTIANPCAKNVLT